MRWMGKALARIVVVVAAGSTLGACFSASSFLKGGDLVDKDLAQGAKRHFHYGSCVDQNGERFEPASMRKKTTHHLVDYKGRPGLFERSVDGTGTVTTNQWEAEDGTHFVSWVNNAGWEYVISRDASEPAMRLMYDHFRPKKEGEATRPRDPPDAGKCILSVEEDLRQFEPAPQVSM